MNLCEVSRDLGVESWVKLNAAFSLENHISKSVAAQEAGVGTQTWPLPSSAVPALMFN